MDALGWRVEGNAGYELPELKLTEPEQELLSELLDAYEEEANDAEAALREILKAHCEEHRIILGKESADNIIRAAASNASGYGPFDFMLADDELEEIAVTGVGDPVRVFHRSKGWLETNCFITTMEFALNTTNKMARPLGRRLTLNNPRLNAVLPCGSRLHASIHPLALNGVEITLRKFRKKPFTILDLASNQTISLEAAAFLWLNLYSDASLLVAGSTGSGKTTTLNALFSFIPLTDRVVITEETPEINVPHGHCVRLIANEELGITLKEIAKDSLRMRPDRVIIGEVRDEGETRALFDSMLAGQARGSYATFHASSAGEAITRLKSLGGREDEVNSIDLILVQKRFLQYDAKSRTQREVRRVTEISEVCEGKARALFEYDAKARALEKTRYYSKCDSFKRLAKNYSFSPSELEAECEKRRRFLEGLNHKDNEEFTREVNAYLFGD